MVANPSWNARCDGHGTEAIAPQFLTLAPLGLVHVEGGLGPARGRFIEPDNHQSQVTGYLVLLGSRVGRSGAER